MSRITNKHLLILAALSITTTTYSQTEDRRADFNAGLKGGVNYSNVWDERDQDFQADSKVGLAVGAFFSIPINEVIGFQPEILFSQKGFQGSGTFLGSSYTYSTTTNYIDIPLMLSIKPSPYISFVVGPQYSFLMSEKKNFNSDIYTTEQFEQNENENIRRNVLGVNTGLDINLNSFIISPRVSWDLIENHGDGSASTPRYKNQFFQLTLGYRF